MNIIALKRCLANPKCAIVRELVLALEYDDPTALTFKIDESRIYQHVRGSGAPSVLTYAEENSVCVVLEQRASKGFGANKQVLYGLALDIA